MGNDGGAMGGGTATKLRWAMGRRWHDGRHNGQRMIPANAEAAQLEATRDGWQRRSQWTAVGGGVIAMDGGSSGGQQQQRNGRRDSKAIAMGDEMAAVQDNRR